MNTDTRTSDSSTSKTTQTGSRSQTTRFFVIDPQAQEVCVAGTFNNWNPTSVFMVREARGRWTRELSLPPGRYEYQLVIDGHWKADKAAGETVLNPFGGLNSVLTILPSGGEPKPIP